MLQTENDEERIFKSQLLGGDYKSCRRGLKGIIIVPFEEENAKGIGYNFTSSQLVYSITREKMLTIYKNSSEIYVYLKPQETVLTLSYEYLEVANNIIGTFHSRVRMNAKGLGSISTTLDPNWKGMLLFSFNNPTKKKIKLVLAKFVNGVAVPENMITLVSKYTTDACGNEEEKVDLHIDNPAMRMDIWAELASKPNKLFQNKNYQKFREIVTTLADFQTREGENLKYVDNIRYNLLKLKRGIIVNHSPAEIKSALLAIKSVQLMPLELEKKIGSITEILQSKEAASDDQFLEYCSSKSYIEDIELVEREIQYQILCDQVKQINEYIEKNVFVRWEHGWFSKLVNDWIIPSLDGIIASILVSILVVHGLASGGEDSLWIKFGIGICPVVASIIFQRIKKE